MQLVYAPYCVYIIKHLSISESFLLVFSSHLLQDASHVVPGDSEDMSYPEEDLFDVENLLDDDTFMSIAFE